ncbi:MAG: DNA polymerase IV [Lachnospiraceae bacterium]|nr:DNA polymerase IV [Lachnospiraceae bacterium]
MKDPGAIILHIDVNSAFLSWSALKLLREGSDVDLRLIPSIVGGDQKTRHGIVVAKSIPAKKYGIQTAETVASALQKCPDLVMIPPEHSYYREQSRQLMEYLSEICPVIQQVSVDECYMDFEPVRKKYPSPEILARKICDGVRETFGFTVNVGVSDRKVLAKMASDFEKPDRVHTLYASEIREKLWPLPIGDLYMCGKSAAAKLQTMGINTIGDLAVLDISYAESWLKKQGRMLWEFANGIDTRSVEPEPFKAKGVGNSVTLSSNAETREEAYAVIKRLCDKVSLRLEKGEFLAGGICTEIKYSTFQSVSHQMVLKTETSDSRKLCKAACELFDEIWNGDPIRLLGVRTTRLVDQSAPVQLNLFDFQIELEEKRRKEQEKQRRLAEAERKRQEEEIKKKKEDSRKQSLEDALGSIRKRYGEDAIRKGMNTT